MKKAEETKYTPYPKTASILPKTTENYISVTYGNRLKKW